MAGICLSVEADIVEECVRLDVVGVNWLLRISNQRKEEIRKLLKEGQKSEEWGFVRHSEDKISLPSSAD